MSLSHDGFETLVPNLDDDEGVLWQISADYGITIAAVGGTERCSVDVENGDKSLVPHARDGDLSVGNDDCQVVGTCLLDVACPNTKGRVFDYRKEILPTIRGFVFLQGANWNIESSAFIDC